MASKKKKEDNAVIPVSEAKFGEVERITETKPEFKHDPMITKSVITMRDGKPVKVFFSEGKEVGAEFMETK